MSEPGKKLTASPIGSPAHRRIAIVGAGIAGLTLASLLQKQDIPFSIYEARNANSIGHSYPITLFRKPWRNLLDRLSDTSATFRQDTAADRLIGGLGKLNDGSSESSALFQAVDRDVRSWFVQRLRAKGIEISWEHKLTTISEASDGKGATLSFEDKPETEANIIIDAGGLRSPAFDNQTKSPPKPELLPYATYYGSRRMTAEDFSHEYQDYFGTGNTIDLIPDSPEIPLIQVKKAHLPIANTDDHNVELRWLFSRPARRGTDPLYRPQRKPEEAKKIPPEFYEEVLDTIRANTNKEQQAMLRKIFDAARLRSDRVLNWHLRLRLPQEDYFFRNTSRGPYQVIAVGDAAHGLPIVESKGAGDAAADAISLAGWLQNAGAANDKKSEDEMNFYKAPAIHRTWFVDAVQNIQRIRKSHGQPELSKEGLQSVIGFWVDGVMPDSHGSGDESSSLSDMEDKQQSKGSL